MIQVDLTAQVVSLLVGIAVAVGLEIIPGLRDKWNDWKWKSLTLFVLALVIPVALWALACFAGIAFIRPMSCDRQGAAMALYYGASAFVSNQGAFAVGAHRLPNARKRALRKLRAGTG
jgi:hypothetical protein